MTIRYSRKARPGEHLLGGSGVILFRNPKPPSDKQKQNLKGDSTQEQVTDHQVKGES